MFNLNWLIRASRWARHPPSARTVKIVAAIVVAGLLIVAAEKMGFWPDWAQVDPSRGRRPLR